MIKFMKTNTLVLAMVAASGLAMSGLASADPSVNQNTEAQKSGEAPEASPDVLAVERASQASDLAALGREMNSPSMMVAAAELMAMVKPNTKASEALSRSREQVPFPRTQEERPQSDAADKPAPGDAEAPTWRSLLDEAEAMADGDEPMLEVIASTRAMLERITASDRSGTMGAKGGPKAAVSVAQARSAVNYYQVFLGGEPAIVSIRGDGDTDLDLYIYDENGNLITSSIGWTDRETVRWTPRWEGTFRIRVVNRGYVWNRYSLLTN